MSKAKEKGSPLDNKGVFLHHCNCGGYAWSMNGRPIQRPHMEWCPQRKEYNAWYDANHTPEPKRMELYFEQQAAGIFK